MHNLITEGFSPKAISMLSIEI